MREDSSSGFTVSVRQAGSGNLDIKGFDRIQLQNRRYVLIGGNIKKLINRCCITAGVI